jgi:hypothetical protein
MISPRDGWTQLPSTANADWYAVQHDVLAILPHEDARDTEASARESIDIQRRHWQQAGHRGGVIIFMENLLDQDSGARAVYMKESDPGCTTCYALIGRSFFAQAIASVFTGLARPRVPTSIFRTLDDALAWVGEMNARHGGPL